MLLKLKSKLNNVDPKEDNDTISELVTRIDEVSCDVEDAIEAPRALRINNGIKSGLSCLGLSCSSWRRREHAGTIMQKFKQVLSEYEDALNHHVLNHRDNLILLHKDQEVNTPVLLEEAVGLDEQLVRQVIQQLLTNNNASSDGQGRHASCFTVWNWRSGEDQSGTTSIQRFCSFI